MKDLLPVPKNGQSLIEALIAMSAAVLIIGGLLVAVTVSIKSAQFSRNQTLATKYANEGMEAVRSIRDRSWALLVYGNYGLQVSGQWSFASNPDTPAVGFTRVVKVEDVAPVDANKKKVTVTVSWSDASGTHKSELVSYFTKWQ